MISNERSSTGDERFDLNQQFHVDAFTDIPQSRWEEVAVWFRMWLEAAGRQQREQ